MHPSIEANRPRDRQAGNLTVAYVLDPRFPGGTSSAVAAELDVVCKLANVEVHALDTQMLSARRIAPQLGDALTRLNLAVAWDSPEIAADVVIFHNPSCLKFQDSISPRIIARHLIVVTHENFLRPGGAPAFDVQKCLSQIDAATICLRRSLAPISTWNRQTAELWCAENPLAPGWSLLDSDWFNICAFDTVHPVPVPRDRRGRHSRPGPEKFPSLDVLAHCFPQTAEANVILGADSIMRNKNAPAHWTLYPFGGMTLERYFDQIDFMVYFTAATWRESFGRVIAEAIAAGKIVITDPETAHSFKGAVIGTSPQEVDRIIAAYIAHPQRYVAHVLAAQERLKQFSGSAFHAMFDEATAPCRGYQT